jgi:hypothetical protein
MVVAGKLNDGGWVAGASALDGRFVKKFPPDAFGRSASPWDAPSTEAGGVGR